MFEYKIIDYLPFEGELNKFGVEGWELIYVEKAIVGYTEKYPIVIFKRLKQ